MARGRRSFESKDKRPNRLGLFPLLGEARVPLGVVGALALLGIFLPEAEGSEPLSYRAVSSESADAARIGMKLLKKGGTAGDAAVAMALMSGVTSATSSGLGGGGFALVWQQQSGGSKALDFREVGPAAIDAEPFEKRPFEENARARATGVPGEIRGLEALHDQLGKLSWRDVVLPAAQKAERGFKVSAHVGKMLAWAESSLKPLPGFASIYFPKGKPAPVGATIKNPALAKALSIVAEKGPDAFYSGAIAEAVVKASKSAGGALSLADLGSYKPKVREPLCTDWDDVRVCTMPAPSAGGMMLTQALRTFSRDELRELGQKTAAYRHILAESMRGSIADRMRYLADPAMMEQSMSDLVAEGRLSTRKKRLSFTNTHALPEFGLEEHGTHHLSVSDEAGNVVSLTLTVNNLFGSKVMVEEFGFPLNDELNDFTSAKAVQPFGMTHSPNRPRAGMRPVSSMTPTIVLKDGRPLYALGGSGGMTIATNVTQVTLNLLAFGMTPAEANSAPRIYIPTKGETIRLEKSAARDEKSALESRGEVVGTQTFTTTAVQVIDVSGQHPSAADPRKHGLALSEAP